MFSVFIISVLISSISVFGCIFLSHKLNILDHPSEDRKLHKKPMPLMGGVGVFFAYFAVLFFILDKVTSGNLENNHWLAVFVGGALLIIGGVLDDKFDLSPKLQIIWPILAAIIVVVGGVSIEKITNPFGGFIVLSSIASSILIFIWLLGMMYTTKLLDGVDGLVGGVVFIGSGIIFLFTMTEKYFQPDISYASLILLGVSFGFLILNWHPAKIFLGEGGSLFLGYILGVLAIISGGKIAIALLVMALPIMDVAWTILRRLKSGKNPFRFADKKHLHHRLLNLGLSQRKTVLIYYFFASSFGLSALFLQSKGKIFALSSLVAIMIAIVVSFNYLDKKRSCEK